MTDKNGATEMISQEHEVDYHVETCDCFGGETKTVTFDSCQDFVEFTVDNVRVRSEGRFLKLRVELRRVCQGKKVNIGVLVYENVNGTLVARASRCCQVKVPGKPGKCMERFRVDGFGFVFPDEVLCETRTFVVRSSHTMLIYWVTFYPC